jgi:transcriptional regulator with XRE-family HTH domain
MRGAGLDLTIGERVAFYRRRRGISQVTLAGLVGRTESWVEKIEGGRAALDRISVVRQLAIALDVSITDLLPDDVAHVDDDSRGRSVPALRNLVLSYRAVNPRFAAADNGLPPPNTEQLRRLVEAAWFAYQDSRFGFVVQQLNSVIPMAYVATRESSDRIAAQRCLAHLYQLAATVLVKLGDLDLARLCADRGDIAAQEAGDVLTRMSLQRSIAHTLLSNGQFAEAVAVVREGVIETPNPRGPAELSVLGTLMLVGATASARAGERAEASTFLRFASQLAQDLGRDGNEVWTSFGPTNVGIHEVTVAAELGDTLRCIDIARTLDVSAMPRERMVRHELEVARAMARVGRVDEALTGILRVEASAPEQVRRHFLTHELVHRWMRSTRARPTADLVALARRLGHSG